MRGVPSGTVRIARAALHFWEEPCISGECGSGTVFFSGCPLRCVYCQNREISGGKAGKTVGIPRLSEIFLELQKKGAANINLVTPTHYTPEIIEAVRIARMNGLRLPIVYNCGGYEKAETIRSLKGTVDIYLTDFKYAEAEPAKRYSAAPDYPETAEKALHEMFLQAGPPVFDEKGMMQKGVIVRHLLLPSHVGNAKKVVKLVHEKYGEDVILSLLAQYTPLPAVNDYPELSRKVTHREYGRLVDYALSLGIENAFIQEEGTVSESFIPPFDGEGV